MVEIKCQATKTKKLNEVTGMKTFQGLCVILENDEHSD